MAKKKSQKDNQNYFKNDLKNNIKMLNHFHVNPENFALDIELLEEIGNLLAEEEWELPENPPNFSSPFDGQSEIANEAISEALLKLPLFLEVADRRKPSEIEIEEFILPELRSYANSLTYHPTLDGKLVSDNHELSPTLAVIGDTLFASEQGVLIFAAAAGQKSAITDGAFVVDLFIEVVGLLTSLVGLKIKLPDKAMGNIKLAIAAFIRSKRGRRLYLDFLKAIRNADWEKVFRLIHKTELGTIFGEIFAHMFADMSWKDYVIAIGKLLVFIGICAASGGAGLALKLAAVALDLVGLGLKVKHAYEHGI